MSFLVILLINTALVVGAGEGYDLVRNKVNKTNDQLAHITEEVEKKTRININVNPNINFNPNINVSPTIKSKNNNVNKNNSNIKNFQKKHNIEDGE